MHCVFSREEAFFSSSKLSAECTALDAEKGARILSRLSKKRPCWRNRPHLPLYSDQVRDSQMVSLNCETEAKLQAWCVPSHDPRNAHVLLLGSNLIRTSIYKSAPVILPGHRARPPLNRYQLYSVQREQLLFSAVGFGPSSGDGSCSGVIYFPDYHLDCTFKDE